MIKLMYAPWLTAYIIMLQQILMFAVGFYRTKEKKGMGAQEDLTLERIVRRHGNLAENAAIFLVSIAVLELQTGPTKIVLALCVAFALARTLHAIGFSSPYGAYRMDAKGANVLFLGARALGAMLTGLSGFACGVAIAIAMAS